MALNCEQELSAAIGLVDLPVGPGVLERHQPPRSDKQIACVLSRRLAFSVYGRHTKHDGNAYCDQSGNAFDNLELHRQTP
jgi:hypothetical protein